MPEELKEWKDLLPVEFSPELYQALYGLVERRLMTSSWLSVLIMLAILPAQVTIKRTSPEDIDNLSTFLTRKYNFENNIERLELTDSNRTEYLVFFPGNTDNVMNDGTINTVMGRDPDKNYIFWNYPGVGSSKGNLLNKITDPGFDQFNSIVEAGYNQVKDLIKKGVTPANITLDAFSFGGAVAIAVAEKLAEEDYKVKLTIRCSFSSIAAVAAGWVRLYYENDYKDPKYPYLGPLISSAVALAVSGIALGTTTAGLIATLGLIIASGVDALGYFLALGFQLFGFLVQTFMDVIGSIIAFPVSCISEKGSKLIKQLFKMLGYGLSSSPYALAFVINQVFLIMSLVINSAINLFGSLAGGAISVAGCAAGGLVGLVFGGILSTQFLLFNKPFTPSMTPAFSAALNAAVCEIDSGSRLQRLIEELKPDKPRIINVVGDNVVAYWAALLTYLDFPPSSTEDSKLLDESQSWHAGTHQQPGMAY